MEKVDYHGWPNCRRLANDRVELIVTTDVGPRIIRFGLLGQDNEFGEPADTAPARRDGPSPAEAGVGRAGGDAWQMYGGHRLWHAPESRPRTYFPDNGPVHIEPVPDGARLIQPTETTTGIQKEIDIHLPERGARARLTHRLWNRGVWPVRLAPWAISVMAPGGVAVVPLPPRGSHEQTLSPTGSLALWAYTDMTDPRWTWGGKYVLLRHDAARAAPQKVGVKVADGWAAYARSGHLFVKAFRPGADGEYPDFGCSVEVFANDLFLELETLGPLVTLDPGARVEHEENWFLLDGVPQPAGEADVDRDVLPAVRPILGQ